MGVEVAPRLVCVKSEENKGLKKFAELSGGNE
jgi:hypothetical protein